MGNSFYKWNVKQRKYMNAQQKKNLFMETLYAYDNKLTEESGIYIFTRYNKPRQDGGVTKYAYIGQAVNVLDRLASHYLGFDQRIDVSLKSRGLKSVRNPYAWGIDVVYCPKEKLNELERQTIAEYIEKGFELYNITAGGQDEGKEYIQQKALGKGYHDGVDYGKKKTLKEIKEYFDKYLDFIIKNTPEAIRKPKNKAERESLQPLYKEIYTKKLAEFENLLDGVKDDEQV